MFINELPQVDPLGKRLITASQSGTVRLWNFNNGALMHEFTKVGFELTQLIYLDRRLHCVVGIG